LVRTAFFSSSAVGIEKAFYASLFSAGTSRKRFRAVRIIQAFYALFFGQRTRRSSNGAVGIGFTSEWEDASGIGATFSSSGFLSSPVDKRAVGIDGTFDTATSLQVAVRSAVIRAVIIGSTEIYANVGKRIAVLLVIIFTTILSSAGFPNGGARIATSIAAAVRNGCRAISVNLARSANSVGLASRLSRSLSSI